MPHSFSPATGVVKMLRNLNNRKSRGPTRILKACTQVLEVDKSFAAELLIRERCSLAPVAQRTK